MFPSKKTLANTLLLAGMGLLAGCGGSSSSSTVGTGTLSLNITDGPVDSATKVVVEFTGVSIKPTDGEAVVFEFAEAKSIDLLQLQGSASDGLLTNEVVASGNYEWIRLHVNAARDDVMDSYMEMDDGTMVELYVPSGAQSGLKLVSGFTIAAGGGADFTIDFDLRKSITNPRGMPAAILKPALRIVDNMVVGSLTGSVSEALVLAECADSTADDGSVYVYAGAGVMPVDIQGSSSDPIATALVKNTDGVHSYEVGFLAEGKYTVAYTCNAGIDEPATAESVSFTSTSSTVVVADNATLVDFEVTVDVGIEAQ